MYSKSACLCVCVLLGQYTLGFGHRCLQRVDERGGLPCERETRPHHLPTEAPPPGGAGGFEAVEDLL